MISSRMTMVYFDKKLLTSLKGKWKNFPDTPVARAGNLVRRIARQSIRRRKNRNLASPKGTPPYAHDAGKLPRFKMIYSVPMDFGTSALVGMVKLTKSPIPVPGIHEQMDGASSSQRTKVPIKTNQWHTVNGKRRRKVQLVTMTVHYPARRFMLPALIKAKTKLPQLWRDSLK